MTARQRDEPERADYAIVRWPGGPYDFVLERARIDEAMRRESGVRDGCVFITGQVVEPERGWRSFCVQPLGGDEYALRPKVPWTTVGDAPA